MADDASMASSALTVAARVIGTALLVASLVTTRPSAGFGWVWAVLLAGFACWLAYVVIDSWRPTVGSVALAACALIAATVAGTSAGAATAMAFVALMVFASRARVPMPAIIAVTCAELVVATTSQLLWRPEPVALLTLAGGLLLAMLLALAGRNTTLAGEQAHALLAQTRRAAEASATAAALAERARIAREIHDIQAHSLSALSLQLEAAGGFLADPTLPAEHPALTKAAGCLDTARRLAREGLTETQRAVRALRTEPGDTGDLPTQLAALVETHADHRVRLEVVGQARAIGPELGLTLYRAIQEGLTNVRKHAPGSPAEVTLTYDREFITATVTNPMPESGPETPEKPEIPETRETPETPPGYGIAGITERAELAGGTVEAGRAGGRWRLSVTIPA